MKLSTILLSSAAVPFILGLGGAAVFENEIERYISRDLPAVEKYLNFNREQEDINKRLDYIWSTHDVNVTSAREIMRLNDYKVKMCDAMNYLKKDNSSQFKEYNNRNVVFAALAGGLLPAIGMCLWVCGCATLVQEENKRKNKSK